MNLLTNATGSVALTQSKETVTKVKAEKRRRREGAAYTGNFWSLEVRKQVRTKTPFTDVGIVVHPQKIYHFLHRTAPVEVLRKMEQSAVVAIEATMHPLRTSVLHECGIEVVVYHKSHLMRFYIFDENEEVLYNAVLPV